jgi:GNAT superfamily N-acetyltransferase
MNISASKTPSNSLKDIFWSVFFKLRNRGVALERHFPWFENCSDEAVFFEATISSVTVGGLVLRQKIYSVDEKEIKVGMIGLVCVTPECRRMGIANELLNRTISYAKTQGISHLTLWTSQHQVYSRHNFKVVDKWLYGWVRTDHCTGKGVCGSFNENKSFYENKTLPLPPFATRVLEYSSGSCSLTLVEDKEGVIAVGYRGDAIDVGAEMIRVLPFRWRLNATKDDPLMPVLKSFGANIDLSPVNLQMWLDLEDASRSDAIIRKITISVLDRI